MVNFNLDPEASASSERGRVWVVGDCINMIFYQLTNFPPSYRTICLIQSSLPLFWHRWHSSLQLEGCLKISTYPFPNVSKSYQLEPFKVRDRLIKNHSVRATSYSALIIASAYSDDGRPFQMNNYRLWVDFTLKLSDSIIHRIGHHGKDSILSRIVRTTHGYSE